MTRAASAAGNLPASASTRTPRGELPAGSYFRCTERPLASLLFLLPLIILYEVGTRYLVIDPNGHREIRIIAFDLFQQFFSLFNVSGRFLPAFAVVGILLTAHIASHDAWQIRWRHLAGMVVESCALAIPLILLQQAVARYVPGHLLMGSLVNPADQRVPLLVLSIGAGIYEELLFRLVAFGVLSMVLIDAIGIPKKSVAPLIVLCSAILFASYHYLGSEVFSWHSLAIRTFAGIYFGVVYLCRGFGVTAGSHAAYDVIIVSSLLSR